MEAEQPPIIEGEGLPMLEPKEAFCTHCETLTYFIPVEEGYECQNCKSINTMKGAKDLSDDPATKPDTFVDVLRPEEEDIL